MDKVDFLSSEINARYGTVKRARGCFLYTAKGVRLTDLYQENGRAILGWGGKSAFTILKNVLDRGITGSFATDFSLHADGTPSRLSRAVSELFAGSRRVFAFHGKEKALKAALEISPDSTSFYRPWNQADIKWTEVDCIVFAPPLPWTDSLYLLAVKENLISSENAPSCARVSAPVCAAITRSLFDLIKALQEREEKHWFVYDKIITKYWERKGPYLFPKIPEDSYTDFILHCLDCGIVINPDFHQPSIVPFGADPGVFRALERNPYGTK